MIDANNVRKEQFRDVRSQITTVNEFNNGGSTSSVMNGGKPGIWTSRRRLELIAILTGGMERILRM